MMNSKYILLAIAGMALAFAIILGDESAHSKKLV